MSRLIGGLLVVILAVGVAACDNDSSILDPDTDPRGAELDLQVDLDLTELVLIDIEAAIEGALAPSAALSPESGDAVLFAEPDPVAVEEARRLLEEARQLYVQAREAWRIGDTETAAQLAFQARLRVAEAWVLVFGEEAYSRHLHRVEQVISWLEQRVDDADSPLLERVVELRDQAEAIRAGDSNSNENLIRATERLVLALQIAHREQAHMRRMEMAQHARLQVFMAQSALGLSLDIAGDDATEEQLYVWRHAQHMTAQAEQALAAGRFRLAFTLGREAENLTLVVVMLEFGPDVARVEALVQLAERAIAAAEEALAGSDPALFPARLLEGAKNHLARGKELAPTRPRVASHILWHASVTAYGVIRLAS